MAAEYVGVDGCRGGWIAVGITAYGEFEAAVVENFGAVLDANPGALVLVDIPIGLRDPGPERWCDTEARKRLGAGRASSVFAAPVRPALDAADYSGACEVNEALTGRRLSRQTFAILRKIREVDSELRRRGGVGLRVREMHPELCFWALAGGQPQRANKKHPKGRRSRIQLLEQHVRGLPAFLLEFLAGRARSQADTDDALDAAVGAVTAFRGRSGTEALWKDGETDSLGFRMEMVYWLAPALPPRTGASSALAVRQGGGRRRAAGTTTVARFRNRNDQIVVRATGRRGTDHMQYVYVLRCAICGLEYGANGSDIFQRRCPGCQRGAVGLACD